MSNLESRSMARRLLEILAAIIVVLAVLMIGRLAFLSVDSHMNKPPKGSPASGLPPCPDRPNCVSSYAEDPEHQVAALPAAGGVEKALERAAEAIAAMRGGRVTEAGNGYLHAEFTSRVFRFRDDLELLYDAEHEVFEVRSASRVGHSDLGANRKRVEELRRRLR